MNRNPLHDKLMGKISDLLALVGTQTFEFVCMAFPAYSEGDIALALVRLALEGEIEIGREGVRKCEDSKACEEPVSLEPAVPSAEESDSDAPSQEALPDTDCEPSAEPGEVIKVPDWSEEASAESLSESYLPEDEIASLVEGLKRSPNSSAYNEDELIGDDPRSAENRKGLSDSAVSALDGDDGAQSAAPPRSDYLLDSNSVDVLRLSARPSNALAQNGIKTIADLVGRLDEVPRLRSMGATSCNEIEQVLARRAGTLSADLSDSQWQALCTASGNARYVFDAYGVLYAVSGCLGAVRPPVDPSLAGVSTGALGLKDTTERRLRANNVFTVEDAVALGPEGLLALPRVGAMFVTEVADALERYCLRNGFSVPSGMRLDDESVGRAFPKLSLDAFLAGCSSVAIGVVEQALRVCRERDYPVRRDSFFILLVPHAEELMAEGLDEEKCVSRIVELFEDEEERSFQVKLPTVREWAESIPGREGAILRARLSGATLQEVAESEGITRQRAQQLADRALQQRPALVEDCWLSLVEDYLLTCVQFEALTGQDASAYHYLRIVASTLKSERRELSALVDDPEVPQELKDRLLDMHLVSDVVRDDGVLVRATKEDIVSHLLRKHASEGPLSLERLLALYEGFLQEHKLEGVSRLASSGARAFGACLERYENVLYARVPTDDRGERKGLRFYDVALKDFSGLRSVLGQLSSRNIEVSATWLARLPEMQEAMRSLDLRNEYELYAIMFRYCQDVPGIELGRVPMLKLGVADRATQIERVIEEVGPATSDVIAVEYDKRYGVRRDTFCGTFLRDFYFCCHDGVYAIERTELSDRQVADLRMILSETGEYCSAIEAEARFRQLHPEWTGTLAAAGNLRGTGFVRSGELLVREGVDEHAVFARLIASHESFSLGEGDFPPEVSSNEAFVSELNKALRSWQVIEVADKRYCSIKKFFLAMPPLSANDFQTFLDGVIASASPGVPFNGFSLRKRGVTAKLDAAAISLGLGMDLVDNVIQLGYVGGKLKRTAINEMPVYCKGSGQFDADDLLAWLLETEGSLPARDVVKRLKELFDIDLVPAQVRAIARRGAMSIDSSTDVISVDVRPTDAATAQTNEAEGAVREARW